MKRLSKETIDVVIEYIIESEDYDSMIVTPRQLINDIIVYIETVHENDLISQIVSELQDIDELTFSSLYFQLEKVLV